MPKVGKSSGNTMSDRDIPSETRDKGGVCFKKQNNSQPGRKRESAIQRRLPSCLAFGQTSI